MLVRHWKKYIVLILSIINATIVCVFLDPYFVRHSYYVIVIPAASGFTKMSKKDVQHVVDKQDQKAHIVQRQHRQVLEDIEFEESEGEASGDGIEKDSTAHGNIK